MTDTTPWLMSDEQLKEGRETWLREYILSSGSQIFVAPWGAGYWLYGVEFDALSGWLAFEFDEAEFDPRDEAQHNAAIEAWKRGEPLPEHYFALDRAFAIKAFNLGIQKWGREWLERGDLGDVDNLIQWTLLGEIRYG